MAGLLFDPARVAAALAGAGADALVLATPPNVLYATRFDKAGSALAIILRTDPEHPVLVVGASDIDFILEDLADATEVRPFGTFHRFRADARALPPRSARVAALHDATRTDVTGPQLTAEILRESGVRSIVADVPADRLQPGLDEPRIITNPALVRRLRMVKTAEEIERLGAAAAITEMAIAEAVRQVATGVTQRQLAQAFSVAAAARGARIRLDNVSLDEATAFGNANQPGDAVAEGTIIRFDVGVLLAGFASDMSRCFSHGPPPARAAQLHAALVDGQSAALDAVRPGARAAEVFRAGVDAVRAAGIAHYDRINVGHGIGLGGDGYDPPILGPDDDTPLEAGMVLCVETPYYELGFAGLQVEDMVVVTDEGWRALTHLPRDLRSVA